MHSITSRTSFEGVKPLHQRIQQTKESVAPLGSQPLTPVTIVGKKCDVVTGREVSAEEGTKLARELGCRFLEASAKAGFKVDRAIPDTVRILDSQNRS